MAEIGLAFSVTQSTGKKRHYKQTFCKAVHDMTEKLL